MIDGFHVIDLHVHSPQSTCAAQDGSFEPERIIQDARLLGFDGLCFTDHFRADSRTERMDRLTAQLALCNVPAGLAVHVGMEAELDEMPTPEEAAGRFVLVSANDTVPGGDALREPRDLAACLLERTLRAIAHPLAGGIAHPLLGIGRNDAPAVFAGYHDAELAGVCESARDRGVILELHRHFLGESKLIREADTARFFRIAQRVRAPLSFGTDSHRIWHLPMVYSLVALAGWIGLRPDDFIAGLPGGAAQPISME